MRFDSNAYSVKAGAVGRPVDVHAYADRIVFTPDGLVVADHTRAFGRNQTVYDPWRRAGGALASKIGCRCWPRKPGALRNGAPFKDWPLPQAIGRVRANIAGTDEGATAAFAAAISWVCARSRAGRWSRC